MNRLARQIVKLNESAVTLLGVMTVVLCLCQAAHARSYDDNPGYIDAVDAERHDDSKELKIFDNPDKRPPLENRIFNQELMTEFRQRYEDRFGATAALRNYYNPNRADTYADDESENRQSVQNDNDSKRSYANYMLRRLVEYHATNFAKSDPDLKVVANVKEAVSNASAGSKDYKVKAGYNVGANVVQVNFLNPYVNTRLVSQVSNNNNNDNVFVMSRDITKTVGVEGRYQYSAGTVTFVGTKKITPALGANITFAKSSYNYSLYSTVREDIALAGMTYIF